MTTEELKAEVEKLWRPCSGPEFPEEGIEVLGRVPGGGCYFYEVYMWERGRWLSALRIDPPEDMAKREWRPIL